MVDIRGSFGKVEAWNDFTGGAPDVWPTTGFHMGGGVGFISDDEGTFVTTVDEPNGVLLINTDVGNDDNAVLFATVGSPDEGTLVVECRFKTDAITTTAMFIGFTQTLSLTAPVMPAEYATTTVTYNGTGSMSGMLWDPDGTANDWRSIFGDAGASAGGTVGGAVAASGNATDAVNDVYDIVRCEVDASGAARNYLNRVLVAELSGAYATTTDNLHAVAMFENRDGSANGIEVDYFYASGNRDWNDGA